MLKRLLVQKEESATLLHTAYNSLSRYYLRFLRKLATSVGEEEVLFRCDLELSIAFQLQCNGYEDESKKILR